MKVYVAAPFQLRELVRNVHIALVRLGIEPTATWQLSESASDDDLTVTEARKEELANRNAILSSHAMLVIGRPSLGGEMFAEAARAMEWSIPVLWTGRQMLSTRLPGVIHVPTVEQALIVLHEWSEMIGAASVHHGRHVLYRALLDAEKYISLGEAAQ